MQPFRSMRQGCARTTRHVWLRRTAALLIAVVQGAQTPAWPSASGPALARAMTLGSTTQPASLGAPVQSEFAGDPADEELVRAQPVCVASSAWSFGSVGDTVLFVHRRHGDELRVGYFVYWSVERPWGQNTLTYTFFPALAIDATYSHFLFVLPGLQRVLYGSGDIEGATVVYDISRSGELSPRFGLAEDATHQDVRLSAADLRTRDGRVVLLTDVWSHQLGARGAAGYAEQPGAKLHCFGAGSLKPLTREVAAHFRLGSPHQPLRARAAWVAAKPAATRVAAKPQPL